MDSNETREWVEIARRRIALRQPLLDSQEASQATWEGWSEWKMSYGRALFLNGDPLPQVRGAFQDAAKGFERVFQMSYDSSAPHYLGSRADPATVTDVTAIAALNASLIAGDLELAQRLARLIPDKPSDPSTPMELSCYTRVLQHQILGESGKAKRLLRQFFQKHGSAPPMKGYLRNYFTLTLALSGIVDGNDIKFNEGLRQQAEFYRTLVRGEIADTPEEHLCDHLIALGNLGLSHGRTVREPTPFLPPALLLSASLRHH